MASSLVTQTNAQGQAMNKAGSMQFQNNNNKKQESSLTDMILKMCCCFTLTDTNTGGPYTGNAQIGKSKRTF